MEINKIHQHFTACNNVCTDTRKIKEGDIYFALKGENFNGNLFAQKALNSGAKYVVIDEDDATIELGKKIVVKNVLKTLQDLANFHRKTLNIPIIALTGSNGKTTTKELINSVLNTKFKTDATVGNFNNHIGVPLTLLSFSTETEIGIVEMGANHQKEIEFLCKIAEPDYGYITNFGKAHLEGFGGIEGVIKGKSELYNYLIPLNKTIFINADDPIQIEKTKNYKHIEGFSNTKTDYLIVELTNLNPFVEAKANNTTIKSNLIGSYNFTNICAAITIANHFNISIDLIKKGIENYIPKNNRSQIIEKGTSKIILDAYNANPSSMAAALENLNRLPADSKIAILGDMFELGDTSISEHIKIAELAKSLNFKEVILIGEHFKEANSSFKTFKNYEEFITDIPDISNSTVLIKGSRGMALERTLDLL